MKKFIALLMAVLCLCGCQQGNPAQKSSMAPLKADYRGGNYTEYTGVEVRVADACWEDEGLVLKVDWINRTSHEVTFGAAYRIERKEGEEWVNCQVGEPVFIAVSYILSPGQTRQELYHVSSLFDVSQAGAYRFCAQFSVEELSQQNLWAEFSLDAGEQMTAAGEVPGMMLRHNNGSVPVAPAGFSWNYPNGDGTMAAVIADHQHPLYCQNTLEPISVDAAQVSLVFACVPDSVQIRCWPDSAWNRSDVPSQDVDCGEDFAFELKPGGYIYEITAQWAESENAHFGSVSYYAYVACGEIHAHGPAAEPQTVADPITSYCGNTQTTLYIGDKEYTFMGGYSVELTDILINLEYDPMRVCRCRPEYTADTEFGLGYGINLRAGYARCEKGQAELTQAQLDTIAEIITWAETTNCAYPVDP